METTENAVFGILKYDFQWEKDDEITLCGKRFSITTIAEALPGENITKGQEANYRKMQQFDSLLTSEQLDNVVVYLKKTYGKSFSNPSEALAYAKPQSVLYKQNGKVVVLFQLPDDDLGMGVEIAPSFSVGVQDMYL